MILIFPDEIWTPNITTISALSEYYRRDTGHAARYLSAMWNGAGGGTGGGVLDEFEHSCTDENVLALEYHATRAFLRQKDDTFLQAPTLESLTFLHTEAKYDTLTEYAGCNRISLFREEKAYFDDLIRNTPWDPQSVQTFRLLLLLLLQLKQKGPAALYPEEKEVLEHALPRSRPVVTPRIYPIQGDVRFLRDGNIYQAASRDKLPELLAENILDCAPYPPASWIKLTDRGALTKDSANDPLGRWKAHGEPPLRMAACWDQMWLLLRQDGGIISNQTFEKEIWDAVWIGAGLNSFSIIRGEKRRAHVFGRGISFEECEGVRELTTWSCGGQGHYGAILEDGTLMVDGSEVGKADAQAICSEGVVFAQGNTLQLYRFDSHRAVPVHESGGTVQALCVGTNNDGTNTVYWITKEEESPEWINLK